MNLYGAVKKPVRLSPNLVNLPMDSTLIQSQNRTSASKLPIKRKTPDPDPTSSDPITDQFDGPAPPFKFHRIWTEPDEIRFLQSLLNCSSDDLAFPRDLGIFYARFANTMSQPYTKSQLSEKLRRLRKKFRVISTRLSKGLDRSQLSVHDRELYALSKRLWHPDYAATSPFSGARNVGLNHSHINNHSNNDNSNNFTSGAGCSSSDGKLKRSNLVGIKVEFSPTLPVNMSCLQQESDRNDVSLEIYCVDDENGGGGQFGDFFEEDNEINEEVKLSEVIVELEGGEEAEAMAMFEDGEAYADEIEEGQNGNFGCVNEVGDMVAKVAMNVFDECFEDVRRKVLGDNSGEEGVSGESLKVRWQRQRIAELDVLGSRLRLVLEQSHKKD